MVGLVHCYHHQKAHPGADRMWLQRGFRKSAAERCIKEEENIEIGVLFVKWKSSIIHRSQSKLNVIHFTSTFMEALPWVHSDSFWQGLVQIFTSRVWVNIGRSLCHLGSSLVTKNPWDLSVFPAGRSIPPDGTFTIRYCTFNVTLNRHLSSYLPSQKGQSASQPYNNIISLCCWTITL